ncbi:DUF4179 domain-containing protein [Oceanirhabdus seepicola]|uniref:DUF4179 domain-containing protein n=1 Tax=Oceanirhabdus seepicola TaxID=2828781 RepID=A0A9J6P5L0_9CLOT|nr:DUF4179 domain-containing protein [Oceanirhabdus seepicola]MCM1992098.1 DUF4179 domain-containing protein [Oceanirhabdus seepicola]
MDKYKNIKEPNDLEEIIENAYKKAKEENKNNIKSKFTKIGATAAAAMIVFAISVNTSTAFANYLDDIPVLDKLAQFFKFDRGLEEAGKKGFLQVIDKTSEDQGITFEIEDVVYDNKRIVIKYSFTSKEDLDDLWAVYGKATYGDGSDLDKLIISSTPIYDNNDENKKSGIIDIDIKGEINKEKTSIIIYPEFYKTGEGHEKENQNITGNWKVDIPIKHELLEVEAKEYNIDDQFEIENMKINIEDLKMYPTVGELEIKYEDENSEYKFSGFTQTYLIDGKGEKFDNMSSVSSITGEKTLRFESNYFIDSSNLELSVGGIYVTPRKSYDFKVDVKKGTMTGICDYEISMESIQKEQDGTLNSIVISVEDDRLVNENINIMPLLEILSMGLENGTKLKSHEDYMVSYSLGIDEGSASVFIEFLKPINQNLNFKVSNLHEYRPINKKFIIDNK